MAAGVGDAACGGRLRRAVPTAAQREHGYQHNCGGHRNGDEDAPTTVVLGSSDGLNAYGGAWFARNSAGGPGSLKLGVCYQDQSGPGPVTVMGSTNTYSITGSQTFRYAAGSAIVAAGTYNVGLCGQNMGTNPINKNGSTSGFVFIGS